MKIQTVKELHEYTAHNLSFPGLYTIIAVTRDGDYIHPECVRKRFLAEARKLRRGENDRIVDVSTYDEGAPLECRECGELIESSYGDPEARTYKVVRHFDDGSRSVVRSGCSKDTAELLCEPDGDYRIDPVRGAWYDKCYAE
jgi:hypothetical protein